MIVAVPFRLRHGQEGAPEDKLWFVMSSPVLPGFSSVVLVHLCTPWREWKPRILLPRVEAGRVLGIYYGYDHLYVLGYDHLVLTLLRHAG